MRATFLVWLVVITIAGCASTSTRADDLDVLLFGSLDGGAASFATVGAKLAADSLDKSGLVALWSVGGGLRRERATCGCNGRSAFTHLSGNSSELFGYQWIFTRGVIAVFAGSETAVDQFTGIATVLRTGWRVQGEAWLRPTDETLIQSTAIAGTTRNSLWMRGAWGYKLWSAYLGPEGNLYLDGSDYRKFGFGLHLTDVAVEAIRLRFSAGLQWETHRTAPGPYLGLAAWLPL